MTQFATCWSVSGGGKIVGPHFHHLQKVTWWVVAKFVDFLFFGVPSFTPFFVGKKRKENYIQFNGRD